MRTTRVSLRNDDPGTGRVASADRLTVMTARMLARSSQARLRVRAVTQKRERTTGISWVHETGAISRATLEAITNAGEPGSGLRVADRAPGPDDGDDSGQAEVDPGLLTDGVAGEDTKDGLVPRQGGVAVAATSGQVVQPVPG